MHTYCSTYARTKGIHIIREVINNYGINNSKLLLIVLILFHLVKMSCKELLNLLKTQNYAERVNASKSLKT